MVNIWSYLRNATQRSLESQEPYMNRSAFRTGIAASILAILMATSALAQQAPASKAATTQPAAHSQPAGDAAIECPVTHKPVDRGICARFRSRWVYFATDDARQKFEKDPLEFAEGVQKQWEADKQLRVQVVCPVTGQAPNSDIYIGLGLSAVYFATPEAKEAWVTDATGYRKVLAKDGYSYQTGCATCGMPIDPRVSKYAGTQKLFFCCEGCAKGFEKDKAACVKRVDEQVAANQAAWENLGKGKQ
jgi:YHS domain-containing protein